jgi:act minimal PKS acyl carrier protein
MSEAFTLETLGSVLRESAGEEEGFSLTASNEHVAFEELGYDSLALLQVTGRLQREYGLVASEQEMMDADTPAKLVQLVRHVPSN